MTLQYEGKVCVKYQEAFETETSGTILKEKKIFFLQLALFSLVSNLL